MKVGLRVITDLGNWHLMWNTKYPEVQNKEMDF